MCKKLIYLIPFVLVLGSVSNAEDIQWTDLGADHLWSTPENWDLGRVPTLADDVRIDVPAAGMPNGPVIQDGIDAKANGIFTEAAGEPTLTMTGGTLEVADWIWWGDGVDSFGIWIMSGGTIDVTNEFELGWGGGAGTLILTGGTINAGEAVIPTGSGAFGELFLHGGTYNVTKANGLSVEKNGLIDIREGKLVLEGDQTAKINDLVAAGLITAYDGSGRFELDYDVRNPGKTTLTAILEPVNPGTNGLAAYYEFENDLSDSSGNGNDGTIGGTTNWTVGKVGSALEFDGSSGYVEIPFSESLRVLNQGDFTLAAWFKPDEIPSENKEVFQQGDANGTGRTWLFVHSSNEIRSYLGGGTTASGVGVEAGIWSHAAVVVTEGGDADTIQLYVNGEPAGVPSQRGMEDCEGVYFIGRHKNPTNFWDGLIDEVKLYNRALSEGELLYLAGKRATPVDPGTDGLVAYYALENNTDDSSGNELHGTIVGDPTYVEGPAGYGTAMAFDGVDDYVDFGNDPIFDITEQVSLAVWVNANDMANSEHNPWLGKGDHTYAIKHQAGNFLEFFIYDGGWNSTQYYDYDESLNGEWHHMAGTYDGSELKFYLDGEVVATLDHEGSIETREHPVTMGTNSEAGGRFYDGSLDEAVIYNRALSAGEIRYLAGFRPGPVAHYKLDEGEGTIAVDSSGNGNDGTLEDGPTVVEGQFGQALEFEDSRVAIPASDSLTADLFQGSFTLSAWINPKRAGDTWQQIFRSMISADTSNDTLFLNNDGRLSWRGRVGGAWAGGMCETASDIVPADQWTHFAVVGDETNFRIYVNGALSQESAFQTTDGANSTYYIGGDPTWIGESYSGMIDEVRIYDRALSSDEVSELAVKAVDPSLVIYYSFDEVGEIVADQSGKGHDGVVVGDITAEPEGKYNGAANFTTGSYLDLDGPSFPAEDIPTTGMTLAAWIKCTNTGDHHAIFNARASDQTWLIHPEARSNGEFRWLLRSYGGTTMFDIRAGAVTWDEWLHFSGTYDRASAKAALYINGELVSELDVASPDDIAGDWGLGARVGYNIDNARPFTGLMDEFRMYTRALSQDEILEIMQGM